MVMATVRKIAPTNSPLLFMHELKTEPQEKFLFPDSLVSNFETANNQDHRGAAALVSKVQQN